MIYGGMVLKWILAWWIGVDGIIGSSWAVSFIWGEVNMEKDQWMGM